MLSLSSRSPENPNCCTYLYTKEVNILIVVKITKSAAHLALRLLTSLLLCVIMFIVGLIQGGLRMTKKRVVWIVAVLCLLVIAGVAGAVVADMALDRRDVQRSYPTAVDVWWPTNTPTVHKSVPDSSCVSRNFARLWEEVEVDAGIFVCIDQGGSRDQCTKKVRDIVMEVVQQYCTK